MSLPCCSPVTDPALEHSVPCRNFLSFGWQLRIAGPVSQTQARSSNSGNAWADGLHALGATFGNRPRKTLEDQEFHSWRPYGSLNCPASRFHRIILALPV